MLSAREAGKWSIISIRVAPFEHCWEFGVGVGCSEEIQRFWALTVDAENQRAPRTVEGVEYRSNIGKCIGIVNLPPRFGWANDPTVKQSSDMDDEFRRSSVGMQANDSGG